ncbi:DUF6415 family natural product biosynthesis protein [Streptomyces sp. NPDC005078]|uniref:DUF6415 family natural product biosynthesis protein n=1 Tax=Streptomyces sp. NPDC005078 TaxID=3154293 RepID=UPI0033A74712
MRLSLAPRREACQRVGRGRRDRVPAALGPQRNQAVAAAETVTLVLDEDSSLPESAADVEELARRLRGHISQLGVMASPGEPALCRAQQVGSESVPDGYMPSRVYLVKLAEATQELVATVQAHGVGPPEADAETALVEAADQPAARRGLRCRLRLLGSGCVGAPDMTVTGAVLIALILGPMA